MRDRFENDPVGRRNDDWEIARVMRRYWLPRILFFRPHPIPVRHAISEPRLYALRVLQILLNVLLAVVYFATINLILFEVGKAIWDAESPRYPDTINLQPLG